MNPELEPGGVSISEDRGVRFVHCPPGLPLFHRAEDATLLIEACFSNRARCALLHPENLPNGFFDLSSGIAGAVLQKLRNYEIRLAVVCAPGSVRFSSRFGEMAEEERRGKYFGIFETADAAKDWLSRA